MATKKTRTPKKAGKKKTHIIEAGKKEEKFSAYLEAKNRLEILSSEIDILSVGETNAPLNSAVKKEISKNTPKRNQPKNRLDNRNLGFDTPSEKRDKLLLKSKLEKEITKNNPKKNPFDLRSSNKYRPRPGAKNLIIDHHHDFTTISLNTSLAKGRIEGNKDGSSDSCPLVIINQVKSSDFKIYEWKRPAEGLGKTVFWPQSDETQIPDTTFKGDWSRETGANFWGSVQVSNGIFTDPLAWLATAAVFQFTIPAQTCDCTVNWATNAVAMAPTDWYLTGDSAKVNTNWVLHVSPEGLDFPTSIADDYTWFEQGLNHSIRTRPFTGRKTLPPFTKEVRTPFESTFQMKAGKSAKIYLGLSLSLWAEDGEASTIKYGGLGDYFEFEHGVTYLITHNHI